ncbi:hypothetical protein I4U23_027252 [Adineta vaga]|nr:hypothetical protein I4U23_027252 [Adineta vaga]
MNPTQLQGKLSYWLFREVQRNKRSSRFQSDDYGDWRDDHIGCYTHVEDEETMPCKASICSAKFTFDESYFCACGKKYSGFSDPKIQIAFQITLSDEKLLKKFSYSCDFDSCNPLISIDWIEEAIKTYYDVPTHFQRSLFNQSETTTTVKFSSPMKTVDSKTFVTMSTTSSVLLTSHKNVTHFTEYIIKKIGFQLKSLEIWSSYDHNYPNQWKELILKHMPHLNKCNIYYPMNINNNLQDFDSDTFIHQFNSSFWFERNWNITIGIEYEKIFYQISSNKYFEKQCNNKNMKILTYSNENNNYRGININRYINDNLSISISSPIKLSITNSGTVKWFGSIVNKLCPVLNLIQIRSLHLIWPNISINDFVELLSHLPHLNSLTWFSSIKIDMNQLSTKDEENLRLLSINNNIKKVSQEIDFKQIQFLINLCPRMEEYEVRGVINDDLEEFIRFIFIENNLNIVHLHSLHLNIIDINDETVNKLQNLIHSEHLLSNYIIKYV